jgi:hypothetical protein
VAFATLLPTPRTKGPVDCVGRHIRPLPYKVNVSLRPVRLVSTLVARAISRSFGAGYARQLAHPTGPAALPSIDQAEGEDRETRATAHAS